VELFPQGLSPVDIKVPSPNAISLGNYVECPVSLFTGLPQINIPLHEMKGKSVSVSISLNYHGSGIRPDVHPAWVGSGWSLEAGGLITRIVKGHPDEREIDDIARGFLFSDKSRLYNYQWSSTAYLQDGDFNALNDYFADEYFFNFLGFHGKFFQDCNGEWRVQSDELMKVEFDTSASNFIVPFAVQHGYGASGLCSKAVCNFVLIDSKGTRYTFGGEDAIEYSDQMMPSIQIEGFDHYAMSWYLTKIETANGDAVVDFVYERGPYISQIHKSVFIDSIEGVKDGYLDPSCYNYTAGNHIDGKIVSPVYLKSIEFPLIGQLVRFKTSKSNELTYTASDYNELRFPFSVEINRVPILEYIPYFDTINISLLSEYDRFIWLKLDSIEVLDSRTGTPIKSFALNYLENQSERLELSSVDFIDSEDTSVMNYELGYDTTQLPQYLTTITDHWGYNNNNPAPTSNYGSNIYNLREPNPNYVKAGILTSMKYPTGGVVYFEYEPNNYHYYINRERYLNQYLPVYLEENGNSICGGVRVKRLISTDGTGNQLIKRYFYVENYSPGITPDSLTSSGILESKPQYEFTSTGYDESDILFRHHLISSNTVIPLSNCSSGRFIGYHEVTEVQPDGGYSVFHFSTQKSGQSDLLPVSSYNPDYSNIYYFTPSEYERGRILDRYDYTTDSLCIRREHFEYNAVGDIETQRAKAISSYSHQVCELSADRFYLTATAFYRNYYKYLLSNKTVYEFNRDNPGIHVDFSESYKYNALGLLTERETSSSDHDSLITRYKYPCDYSFDPEGICEDAYQECISLCAIEDDECLNQCDLEYHSCFWNMPEPSSEADVIIQMQNKHMLENPIEIQSFRKALDTEYLLGGIFHKYQIVNDLILPESDLWLNPQHPLESSSFSFINDSDGNFVYDSLYKTVLEYDLHDSICNLLQFHKADDIRISYIWGYNNSLPVAVVVNAEVEDIGYDGYEEVVSWAPEWTYLDGTRSQTFSRIGQYSLLDAQIIITPNINSIVSLWAMNGTLSEPSIEGYSPSTVLLDSSGWTYYEWNVVGAESVVLTAENCYIDEVRLYPIDASMTTYNYRPIIGMTSQTDPNGITTYYEYDSFSRLEYIRDHNNNILKAFDYNYAQPVN
jgi:YD repeat-containing protein